MHDDLADHDRVEERPQKKKHRRRDQEGVAEDEDEDEEEDEDDEEEEDDEEDPGEARAKKRRKVFSHLHRDGSKRHKRSAVNRFLDIQAEVDDDEDDEEEDEEDARDLFDEVPGEGEDLDDMNHRAAHHARLDRNRELNDEDLARIAQDVTRRYRPTAQKYTGDMNEIPQRLLMPSVQDANLWQVRVRPGKERDIVFSLMRKAMDQEFTAKPLQILSAFQRDSLPGMIYVEARSSQQVSQAINGLVGVFLSRGITLVPIEEMATLLQIKKKDIVVTPGSWVRIRRGKYSGDLAQVLDIAESGEEVGLKFVPRIDLNPKDEIVSADGKKRKLKGSGMSSVSRPPQRFFNYEEVVKVYGRRAVAKRNQVYVFNNDTFRDGYIEKDFKLATLILENVNPTLDEIMKFTRREDGAENEANVDLSIIAETAKKEAIQVLQPGDHVEVFEGEQTGVHGVVESIANDVVTLRAIGVDIEGQKVDVPARSVRKRFKVGDHVKVMSGQNADETGLVVSVVDNVVTFLSDMTMQELSVFSKDLREAAEVGLSTNIVGNYELHDLVQLDSQTVGVIFKTERDSFRVLDQNGQVRLVQPHQIAMRRDSNRAIATDAEGHELRINDNVKEVDGEERKGQVLHIHQSFYAFLFNREISENDGVFVTRARSLVSLAPKGNAPKPGAMDLTKMNPALSGGAVGGMVGSQMSRGPRDNLVGQTVVVIKGPQKGFVGIVKDTNGPVARVELQMGNRVITIDKMKLKRKNPDGTTGNLEKGLVDKGALGKAFSRLMMPPPSFGGSLAGLGGNMARSTPTANPYNNGGGRTPGWGAGRTPNPYASDSSRTPGWGARTPNPYTQDGSRTPAWNAGARTPAWNHPARTPNPYTADREKEGNRTPAWNINVGRTPAHQPDNSNDWGGGSSPRWQSGQSTWGGADTWGETFSAVRSSFMS
ncbi:transcription elongation factor Spt5 [Fomitiporia mediterranea MF3/22]|uniref:transcription elongation factor Spt5 n=1 Tax=Fomitiporia mediterranea (strain MF3/22) TaxID=694068 RepID=UPI0004407A58|nr:transcription elongation factor Spt5 [Fomitiporia mediterranea MF3/22]EJD01904.1 transcription elongation factor Spt5 [Fomitiporia mediterranea MF3/22]